MAVPVPAKDKKRIHKHGEKQKLHMLPNGFIDRSKKADKFVFTGPIVEKMSQRTCDQDKNDS